MKKNKRNGNGTVTPIANRMPEIQLSGEEATQITALDHNLARAKLAVADVVIQIRLLEKRRDELLAEVAKSQESLTQRVVGAAETHGININDASQAWNFSATEMTFTRMR